MAEQDYDIGVDQEPPKLKVKDFAAKIKAKYSISFADAFAAVFTIRKKATLITGDKEFDLLLNEANFKVKYL